MNKHLIISAIALGSAALAQAQGQPPAQTPPAAPPAAAAAAAANAPRPTKFGYIFLQQAVLGTEEGKKASAELQTKFAPKRAELDRKQSEIAALTDQLKKGSATMSDDARAKVEREIDTKTKQLNRDTDDASTDMEQEGNKVMGDIASKMQAVVQQYSVQNGYAVILDTSSQQSPVFWAATSSNITEDIVKLYNSAHPVSAAAAPPKPLAPKPSTPPPPAKKQ